MLDDFKKEFLGEYHHHKEETNEKCHDCGNPHMDYESTNVRGYPKFKCGCCGVTKNDDPRVQELNRRIDYKFKYNAKLSQ